MSTQNAVLKTLFYSFPILCKFSFHSSLYLKPFLVPVFSIITDFKSGHMSFVNFFPCLKTLNSFPLLREIHSIQSFFRHLSPPSFLFHYLPSLDSMFIYPFLGLFSLPPGVVFHAYPSGYMATLYIQYPRISISPLIELTLGSIIWCVCNSFC
jgi:hypothetical protein